MPSSWTSLHQPQARSTLTFGKPMQESLNRLLRTFTSSVRPMTMSKTRPSPKMSTTKVLLSMAIWKSPSIYLSRKRIPRPSRLLSWPSPRAIHSVSSAWKMKATRAASTTQHGPIIGLFAMRWKDKPGAFSIRPMPISTSTVSSFMASTSL